MTWTSSWKSSKQADDTLRVMLCTLQDSQINSAIWHATVVGDKRAFKILTAHYRKRGYVCYVHEDQWKQSAKHRAEARREAAATMRHLNKMRARIARETRGIK